MVQTAADDGGAPGGGAGEADERRGSGASEGAFEADEFAMPAPPEEGGRGSGSGGGTSKSAFESDEFALPAEPQEWPGGRGGGGAAPDSAPGVPTGSQGGDGQVAGYSQVALPGGPGSGSAT